MITAARFRTLALALDDASEAPHMERIAFRTTLRIFATLAGDGGDANLKLALEQQELLSSARPLAFAPVSGGWGKMGWTRVSLKDADEADVKAGLAGAHALALVKNKPKKRR
ncbi:MAG: MmcQ/YjbR family DNA-binding protein [Deltaproteobacteria bacterium]|nr:MmcQ/YjbR family DNA-binding protein [Deltaproteobacteria bacterium]